MSFGKILLIEDNQIEAKLIMDIFQCLDEKYQIKHVTRLSDAVKLLEEVNQFRVVLCDLTLPDSFGLKTFSKVKQYVDDIPVIILTSLDDDDVAEKFISVGAEDYIVKKTLNPNILSTSINNATARYAGPLAEIEPVSEAEGSLLQDYSVNLNQYLDSSLKDVLPDVFQELVDEYREFFNTHKNSGSKAFKVSFQKTFLEHKEGLFVLKASPNDIFQIHLEVLKSESEPDQKLALRQLFEFYALLYESYSEY